MIGRLARKGLVRRVHPGVYASLNIVETALPPPRLPLLYQLREVVDRGGRAMTIAEIHAAAGVPEERRVSATGMLSTLVRKGLVRRVGAGVYAPLREAAAAEPPTMGQLVLAALAKHPEGLDVATLCARVQADDEELDEVVRALLRDKARPPRPPRRLRRDGVSDLASVPTMGRVRELGSQRHPWSSRPRPDSPRRDRKQCPREG